LRVVFLLIIEVLVYALSRVLSTGGLHLWTWTARTRDALANSWCRHDGIFRGTGCELALGGDTEIDVDVLQQNGRSSTGGEGEKNGFLRHETTLPYFLFVPIVEGEVVGVTHYFLWYALE
jgi:hypothetical protein